MSERAILVRDLRMSYGSMEAVRGISFEVDRGEVFGLLGPNGAGKTSTVEILEGYRRRSAGEVAVLGYDPAGRPRTLRERIGIVTQEGGFHPRATVGEAVALAALPYPAPRDATETIELVGLTGSSGVRVKALSGGQRRRLDLALALVGDPEVLFLDEPTTGFDPQARRGAWEVVRRFSKLGKTVLLTTHYLEEAQALADRVAILKDGRIVAEGPPGSLGPDTSSYHVSWRENGGRVEHLTEDPTELLARVSTEALADGRRLEDLRVARPSLEDVYLELTDEAE
ncbi:MAG: ABC transporter ATP-binding protein [Thermoleophilaceae bacterium]|nr:ABC transporter ATP-binding protein [Thermoleophilaceae bacterium]